MKKYYLLFFFLIFHTNLFAEEKFFYLDVNFLLSESEAGKYINNELQLINNKNIEEFKKIENSIKIEEEKLLKQKNILKEEEFNNKANIYYVVKNLNTDNVYHLDKATPLTLNIILGIQMAQPIILILHNEYIKVTWFNTKPVPLWF